MTLAVLVPLVLLLIQYGLFALGPAVSRPTAYIVMVAAPCIVLVLAAARGMSEGGPVRAGWFAIAASLLLWALGAFGNLWQEWVLGRVNEMYRDSMLAFNLAAVPIAFVLAGDWRSGRRSLARATAAAVALALGYGFFLYTWEVLTAHGTPDEAAVTHMVWLLDLQNFYLAIGSLARWSAADTPAERNLFRALLVYEIVYLVLVFYNNHFVAGDPAFGPEQSAIITVAFGVLAGMALWRPAGTTLPRPDPRLVRMVRSASPMLLAGALLIVSLFVIRIDYAVGTAGVLIAVVGYTLRTTLNQVVHIERGDILLRERSELQTIAWTDSLTGLANRHFLDQALGQSVHSQQESDLPFSVLMIDIDHFKLLNDRYGHPAGDACLREVANVLRRTIVRPGDVLGRYGGEEFIALVHDTDSAGALAIAEQLRTAVEALRIENLGSPFGVVTVSVGAASSGDEMPLAAAELVARADRALYDAKRAGRNQSRALAVTPG